MVLMLLVLIVVVVCCGFSVQKYAPFLLLMCVAWFCRSPVSSVFILVCSASFRAISCSVSNLPLLLHLLLLYNNRVSGCDFSTLRWLRI